MNLLLVFLNSTLHFPRLSSDFPDHSLSNVLNSVFQNQLQLFMQYDSWNVFRYEEYGVTDDSLNESWLVL